MREFGVVRIFLAIPRN